MISYRNCITLSILVNALAAYSQVKISGTFLDSATFRPVAFVQIQVGTKSIHSADANGVFSIMCYPGDTLHITRLGYKTITRVATTDELSLTILMSDVTTQLNSVTIFGRYKPQGYNQWFDNSTMPKPYQNPSVNESFGFGLNGAISYFTKYERQRRKLRKLQAENLATAVYRSLIASDEVKGHFMSLLNLTEGQYFLKIEAFNSEFPESQYLKEKDDIMDLLTYFFTRKEK